MIRPPRDADTFLREDWFAPAILSNGSVAVCLREVEDLQILRARFISLLRERLVDQDNPDSDALTSFGQKLKVLEVAIRSRVGILPPDRPQAWFRAPVVQEGGPFSPKISPIAVIGNYPTEQVSRVRETIDFAWKQRTIENLPFSLDPKNLWGELLTMNAKLKQLIELPEPFQSANFIDFSSALPRELASESLAAFLGNVSNEAKLLNSRLESAYQALRALTEKLWTYQEKVVTNFRSGGSAHSGDNAKQMRDEFKRRRHDPSASIYREGLTRKDLESLQSMGFSDFPDPQALRSRYIELAKRYHPDRGGDETVFKDLTQAYSYLNDRIETISSN